ncbi:D-alanine--D-alanine ligase [Hydrogenimonas sp. SS33]|uniref:D-alanine--D-alanine ligase n=1 Tax=Hydrogenimonas leucolamina TaxID=2954236 RepID=UPI00336BB758
MKFTILFGGASYEHEISIVSAIALKKVLKDNAGFIFLDAEGGFYDIAPEKMKSNLFSSGDYKKEPRLHLAKGGFAKKGMLGSKTVETGTLVNLVHGAQGEDGTLAALLDFYAIPYIGPRKEASVVSFNKWLTKLYAEGLSLLTVDYQLLRIDEERQIDFDYPVIVKPVRLGSSIGVSIVKKPEELDFALDVAFEFDDEVLVEPFIEGIEEYNVAGCKTDEGWVIGRIEAPRKKEFLDFDQKYLDFARTDSVQEAKIDETLANDLVESFKKVYNTAFEGAVIRCDFFFASGEILLNEINPIPGSMANYLFDDFPATLEKVARALPKPRRIRPDYAYIHKVQSAKGPKMGS